MPVRLGGFGAAAWFAAAAVSFGLALVAGAAAQSPAPPPPAASGPSQPKPVTGFVPTFEIMRTVRSAGFDPLAPPLREGTTYVLRATDYRGILMRVVIDARTGAIRDVTRIVPTASGALGVVLPPYGPPAYASPYGEPPYGAPAEYEGGPPYEVGPPMLPGPERDGRGLVLSPKPLAAPPITRAKTSTRKSSTPLPRPRPAALASSHHAIASPNTEKGAVVPDKGPAAAAEAGAGHSGLAKPEPVLPAPSPPAAQAKSPAPAPLSD
jgi:hypothetical protein